MKTNVGIATQHASGLLHSRSAKINHWEAQFMFGRQTEKSSIFCGVDF